MPDRVHRARRVSFAVAAVGVTALALIGCTRNRRPIPRSTTTVVSTPTTDSHGHTDDDHANMTTTTRRSTTPTTDSHGHTDDDHANMTTTTVGGGHSDDGHPH